jgi:hypothetical protein
MSLQQKAVAMLGFGEEPIPDAEFNKALRYVKEAYVLLTQNSTTPLSMYETRTRSEENGWRV